MSKRSQIHGKARKTGKEPSKEVVERIFGNMRCGICHGHRPCEWMHIEDLTDAGDTKLKEGYWACYWCYNNIDGGRPYSLQVEEALGEVKD
jgi:hypothetical protein